MATELIDYAWARPNLAQVKAAGRVGVIRYLTGRGSKALSRGEIAQIKAAGLSLTLVYETTGTTVKGGHQAGINDATDARNATLALGLPLSLVYFAVDYDMRPGEYALLDAYLDGAASVLGKALTGVYAGYGPCAHAMGRGYAAWQTYAWSGGKVAQGIRMYQYANGQRLGGGDCDFVRTSLADYGQVKWGAPTPAKPAVAPAPAPASVKPAAGVRSYVIKAGDTLSGIANRFGTTWQRLQQLNGIRDANRINAGQSILIDVAAPAPAPAAKPAAAATYTVRKGDTLSGIAATHHTTWQALAAKNNIKNPNLIHPGQTIRI
jgi:LysM repeat protein